MRSATAPDTIDCRGDKDHLEEEIGQRGVVGVTPAREYGFSRIVRAQHERNTGPDAVDCLSRVHDVVAHQHVHDTGDGIQRNILRENFRRVLGANESGLQHGKTGRHPHDEGAHNKKVKCIERVFQLNNGSVH